jgi:hypothetical protein
MRKVPYRGLVVLSLKTGVNNFPIDSSMSY